MKLHEPATALTDYALTAMGLVWGSRLLRGAERRRRPAALWASSFLVTAAASAAGGTYHGFGPYLSRPTRQSLWNTTVFLIGAGTAFMISAAATASYRDPRAGNWLRAGLTVTLVGFGIQQSNLSLHRHFNQNDIYHCLQLGGLYCLYRGAASLSD